MRRIPIIREPYKNRQRNTELRGDFEVWGARDESPYCSLLQQPGPKKFKLSKIELIYKAKKFKVPPLTI